MVKNLSSKKIENPLVILVSVLYSIDTGDAVQRVLSGERPGKKTDNNAATAAPAAGRRNSNSNNKENNRPGANGDVRRGAKKNHNLV